MLTEKKILSQRVQDTRAVANFALALGQRNPAAGFQRAILGISLCEIRDFEHFRSARILNGNQCKSKYHPDWPLDLPYMIHLITF